MASRRGEGTATVSFTVRVYAHPSVVGLTVEERDEDDEDDEEDDDDEDESDSDCEDGAWDGAGDQQLDSVFARAAQPPQRPAPAHARGASSDVRTADLLQF